MGNLFSRQAAGPSEFTTEWIENLYAARAAAYSADSGFNAAFQTSVEDDDGSKEFTPRNGQNQAIFSAPEFAFVGGTNNITVPSGALEAATIHLTIAVRSAAMKCHDALKIAVDTLKNMDLVVVAKAIGRWIKAHPGETAAIVIPLVLLACTPAFLGLAGFTAGGIAAGSIAAGFQAGIGSVAAGSVFATLTSAAMGGFGVPIVFGGVWLTSSAVLWGITAWKKWRKGEDDDTGDKEQDDSKALMLRTWYRLEATM